MAGPGRVDPRFAAVREEFASVIAAQPATGAALAVCCDGRLVVDLWGGYADRGRVRTWDAGTLVQPYSVSKPFAAVCALHLAEAGRLELDAPVQRYWPEFRAPATVRQAPRTANQPCSTGISSVSWFAVWTAGAGGHDAGAPGRAGLTGRGTRPGTRAGWSARPG